MSVLFFLNIAGEGIPAMPGVGTCGCSWEGTGWACSRGVGTVGTGIGPVWVVSALSSLVGASIMSAGASTAALIVVSGTSGREPVTTSSA